MTQNEMEQAVEQTARDLVRLERIGGSSFLNLPILYPDGSSVTVKIDRIATGLRVSDAGFAYREIEDIGADRSFGRTAKKIAEERDVRVGKKTLYVDATADTLFAAICDVATASWQVADKVYSRVADQDEQELEDELTARLEAIFGPQRLVSDKKSLKGESSTEWPVSAVVSLDDHMAVYQAVGDHANSIYRAATAFRDLSALRRPPRLIAVVRDQDALGSRLALLSQASASVINRDDPDERFRKAAA